MTKLSRLILITLLIGTLCYSTTYYVNPPPTGDDGRTAVQAQNSSTPWATIGHAVIEAIAGDVIKVMDNNNDGTVDYTEQITVNKSLTIERENTVGANPNIQALNPGADIFVVTANDVTINGLTLQGNFGFGYAIHINGVTGCMISNNQIGKSGSECWIGVQLSSANSNTITDNNLYVSAYGIQTRFSSDNTISNNIENSTSSAQGIVIGTGSNNNTIHNNQLSTYSAEGILVNSTTGNQITSNTVTDCGYHGIDLNSCTNTTIAGNTCTSNTRNGIQLRSSSNNTISGNTCSSNDSSGIKIISSSNSNQILNNTFSNNAQEGVYVKSTSGNKFRGNYIYYNIYNNVYLGTNCQPDFGQNDVSDKGRNTIINEEYYLFYNGSGNAINAYYNYWGTDNTATIDGRIRDNEEGGMVVNFDPLLTSDESLPVSITEFKAVGGNNKVTLHWETESEVDNAGFQVYRAKTESEPYHCITPQMIHGAGNSSEKHIYSFVDRNVVNGIAYYYKLNSIDMDETIHEFGPAYAMPLAGASSNEYCLHPNYPNPFNPETTISYDLANETEVKISVFNVRGEIVKILVNSIQEEGAYQLLWQGDDALGNRLPSGVYFLKIATDSFISTRKMTLVQ